MKNRVEATRTNSVWKIISVSLFLAIIVAPIWVLGGQQSAPVKWRSTPATTERMMQRLEEAALKQPAESTLTRMLLLDIAYPRSQEEYRGLDGNAVIYIAVLTQDKTELPIARVSIVAEGKRTPLMPIYTVLSDQSGSSSLSSKKFGPYRTDTLFLFPVSLRLKPGEVVVDLAGNKGSFEPWAFSATVPPQIAQVVTESSGNGPSEQVLDGLIRREFPGILDGPLAKRASPGSEAELAEITARGRKLAQYDQAAWHATDAVMELKPAQGNVTQYIATEQDGRWTVIFGRMNEKRDKFLVAYEAIQGDSSTSFTAKKLDLSREETGFRLNYARALDTARTDFGKRERPYNAAVVPASYGRMFVYLIPTQTAGGIFPLGGDIRYLISEDGTAILEKREMHRGIIEFKAPSSGKMDTSFHTAVLDDIPEDTDVFHVLARSPSISEWVLTPQFAYVIKTDGTINYITTLEAFKKFYEHKK